MRRSSTRKPPTPVFLLAALLLSCDGGSAGQDPNMRFSFTAYGDCRKNHDVHRRICASMHLTRPRFVIITGDLVDHGEREGEWKTFREITADLASGADLYPVSGDHDGQGKTGLLHEFGLEKPYYDRVVDTVHLFLLDSGRLKDPEQLKWFTSTAAASRSPHKIAVFHHPPFSIDGDRGAEAGPVREAFHPLLVKYRFCGAVCGHNHTFYTTVRDGIRYVVTGGGGAHLWRLDESLAQKGDLWRSFFHYVGFRIEPGGIEGEVVDSHGTRSPDLAFTFCRHR